MKALAYMFPDKGVRMVSFHLQPAQDRLRFARIHTLLFCSASAVSQEGAQGLLLLMQAIQARQVLRGTVAELVKETRKQEAEGALLVQLNLENLLSCVVMTGCRLVSHQAAIELRTGCLLSACRPPHDISVTCTLELAVHAAHSAAR